MKVKYLTLVSLLFLVYVVQFGRGAESEQNELDDEKLWWEWSDGTDKFGKCGPHAPKLENGKLAQCNPDSMAPCCSEWGFCGISQGHCGCDKCVDYRPKGGDKKVKSKLLNDEKSSSNKTWWSWEDGTDKMGRCGPLAPKISGRVPECDPNSEDHCCSEWGFCGGSKEHCTCKKCVDYRKSIF